MAEWRVARGWSEDEIAERLSVLEGLPRNFDAAEPKTMANGWKSHWSDTVVGREPPGPPEPGGAFLRGWEALTRYEFSDPRIVEGHFDPDHPLEGRPMLLELKPLFLRFLSGVRVGATRQESDENETVRGFRYDTLLGHVERGWEWFTLTKSHGTGEIRFRIAADWQPGDFPNWWSRIGFGLVGIHYQRLWIHRAHVRLRRLLRSHRPVPEPEGALLHEGPEHIGGDR